MAGATESKPSDLVIVTDATGSMGSYLAALRTSLPQILSVSRLTGVFQDIGVLAYRDFCGCENITEWSGWLSDPEVDLAKFASNLSTDGGGDYPEAAKTAIYELSTHLHEGRKTLIVWYTDAPPHHNASRGSGGNREREVQFLSEKGELGNTCLDWVSACRLLAERDCQVVTVLGSPFKAYDCFYALLGHFTHGGVLNCDGNLASNSRLLSQLTVDFLLGWMGVKGHEASREDEDGNLKRSKCKKLTFKDEDLVYLERMKDENEQCEGVFPKSENNLEVERQLVYTEVVASIKTLAEGMEHLDIPIGDLSKRFMADDSYKKLVYRELKTLIEEDVTAISLNAVFGDLWRVICKQKEAEERDELVNAFSHAIGTQLKTVEDKEMMTKWLEESYDRAGEINELLEQVPEEDRFPAVCIDPTMCGEEIMGWRREDLMEIGRSCQPAVLKKLGQILSKLVYLPSKEEVPAHIANDEDVVKLPLSMAAKENKRKFWTLLLHLVMPGTLLGSRPGALLAALCLRVEVPFLKTQARECMSAWRGRWADLEVGENWSMGCLRLLLRVDKMEKRRSNASTSAGSDEDDDDDTKGFLTKFERSLFRTLCDYKMADLNLNTQLTAQIPFTPNKAYGYLARTTQCKLCKVDRSVTMMSSGNVCGICVNPDEDLAEHKTRMTTNTDTSDGETTKACWVECAMGTCRAQYVVYNVEKLKVRPKCWYCRQAHRQTDRQADTQTAPWVECSCCKNRVIWPKEYCTAAEEENLAREPFKCGFCKEGRKTIVEEKITAKELLTENPKTWILGEKGAALDGLLTGRSMFGTVKALTMEVMETVEILPLNDQTQFVYKSKPVLNSDEVKAEFRSWVSKGQVESGTCTLCFESNFRKNQLLPACGRSGCHQFVDADCLRGWYGQNRPGALLNIMALHCPFCRRAPAGKTLEKYGMGVSAVGGLGEAVSKQGHWIFGWCQQCGFAKRVMERVCANGGPPELEDWKCEDCVAIVTMNAKACPGCGTMTQRTAGCNHIVCPVAGCGADWCFVCRFRGDTEDDDNAENAASQAVYVHMEEVHGGYYGNGDDRNELESEYSDED